MLFDYYNLSTGTVPHHHTTKESLEIRKELDELDLRKASINLDELTLQAKLQNIFVTLLGIGETIPPS